MSDWSVYIVRTRLNTLYTGIATDVDRRLSEHEAGGREGAKYLRSKGPLEIVYQKKIGSRDLASKVEYRIKKLARHQKDQLVEKNLTARRLLTYLGLSSGAGA